MADKKISELTALNESPASGDLFVVVDVSDTTDSSEGTNKKVPAQYITPADYSVLLRNTTDQTIDDILALSWDTEVFDTDTMHDGTNPTRITFNHAGKYLVIGSVSIPAAGNEFRFDIRLNGSTLIASQYLPSNSSLLAPVVTPVTVIYNFAVNDYVELIATVSDESATAQGTGTNLLTFFEAKKI